MNTTLQPASPLTASAPQAAQQAWAATPLRLRLKVLRSLRNLLALNIQPITAAVSPELSRTPADTVAAEILPLLAACKFLESEAPHLLAPRTLGRRGLPFWLSGVDASIERVPFGTILLIAPANYPLFLPAVQAIQALAAGNAVVWKPGRGGQPIAQLFASLCTQAGLPPNLLRITDESIAAATAEIHARPGKILFTGSAAAGRAVQHLAADLTIPVIAELSGSDAVLVLPTADPARVVDAVCFGMRLNGSATCMAPRRLILIGETHQPLLTQLQQRFAAMDAVFLPAPTRQHLEALLAEAQSHGVSLVGELGPVSLKPILVLNASPAMELARTDVFAPILAVFHAPDPEAAIRLTESSPFGLTAAVFGNEAEARAIAARLTVGTVLINDLIVPTADPRVPFGGRKASGFGLTRGAEGLLELTSPKVLSIRRSRDRRHLQPTTRAHEPFFRAFAVLTHATSWSTRLQALRQLLSTAIKLSSP
jgi:acyl-CoA reductase-like NAD-dependent aldehyde dehydrogenase